MTNSVILGWLFHFVPYFAPMHPGRMVVLVAAFTAGIELLSITGIASYLALQLVVSGIYFVLVGIYHICCVRGRINNPQVMRPLFISYASMLLYLRRTTYRLVEHFGVPLSRREGDGSELHPVLRGEWDFLVFEATFILLAVMVWIVGPPSRLLPSDPRMYLAQDGKTVLKGPGWEDSRSMTETFFNPFQMLSTRDGHQRKFWEQNGYSLGTVKGARK
ncbi:hypothetical protein VTG60DRAFT_1611 [Thermothelomyces hinnuleus]